MGQAELKNMYMNIGANNSSEKQSYTYFISCTCYLTEKNKMKFTQCSVLNNMSASIPVIILLAIILFRVINLFQHF
jgi:hypothetical protein